MTEASTPDIPEDAALEEAELVIDVDIFDGGSPSDPYESIDGGNT